MPIYIICPIYYANFATIYAINEELTIALSFIHLLVEKKTKVKNNGHHCDLHIMNDWTHQSPNPCPSYWDPQTPATGYPL